MDDIYDMEKYIGRKYHRLTITEILPKIQGKVRDVFAVCDCGNEVITSLHNLKYQKFPSCGCRNLPLIGTKFKNKVGFEFEILGHIDERKVNTHKPYKRLHIRFTATGTERICDPKEVSNGAIKDILSPSVCGVGFLGKEGVDTTEQSYQTWVDMLKRCYKPKSEQVAKTYKDCSVSSDWHNYSNFKKWYDKTYIQDYRLDKDLKILGNRFYSEDTCTWLPNDVNVFFTGGLVNGVHYSNSKGKWVAQCQDGKLTSTGSKRQTYLGSFDNEVDALSAYKEFKLEKLLKLKDKFPLVPEYVWVNGETFIKSLKPSNYS